MELKINRESLACSVPITDTEVTQAVEHDFVLPDYCPDIFRVLKCSVIPGIISTGINGGRLSFELSVTIRVIYRREGAGVYCVEHTEDYSKVLDIPADALEPTVDVTAAAEYVNCRVVDRRRLDVRGSVICRVRVQSEKRYEAVCDAFGCGIQLKKSTMVLPTKRLTSAKRITVVEELELAAGKPPLGSILRLDTVVSKGEQKLIPGKLITKGEAMVSMLYLPKDAEDKPPEPMKFSIPFSQIIDIDGIEEGYDAEVDISAARCIITPKPEEATSLECELILLVNIKASRYDSCELVTDAYSTLYECECERLEAPCLSAPRKISSIAEVECTLRCSDGQTAQVYDLWCESPTVMSRYEDESGCLTLYGKATICMLARLESGEAAYAEKECAFERQVDSEGKPQEISLSASVQTQSYSIGEDGVHAKAELLISGSVSEGTLTPLMSAVRVNCERQKKSDSRCAVKICYTASGESLWDVAKKYSTSAAAIAEENDSGGMSGILIIPMKN